MLFRFFREEEKVFCPQCGNGKVDRLLSLFGFKSTSNRESSSTGSNCSSCSGSRCDTCN
ncbi:zinc ribbon domain-containing protein [candidate division NPL-UPA2 bacterium]|nr:zinc ribbon domain-containing protein [candidate division NPL-UPA2 bacterium]